MKMLLVVTAAIMLSVVAAAGVVHNGGPSTSELDADIATVKAEIATTNAAASRYSGGLLLVQIQLRSEILKNTETMLEQKRVSFLRGISLSYQDAAPRIAKPADDAAAGVELAKARAEAEAAQQEAARYSGGLIQVIALVRAETARTTAAAIEQRMALAKNGIPLAAVGSTALAAQMPPGTTVPDKGAL
jgi:uncharacterized small protein (DUF1192 family)